MFSYLSSSTELSLYHLTVRERHLIFFRLTIVPPLELLHCFGLVLLGHPTLSEKFRVFLFSNKKVFLYREIRTRVPTLVKAGRGDLIGGSKIFLSFCKHI